ncbi:metallophosphoesterase, partial [bacterium]
LWALVGYSWMGFVFLLFSLSLCLLAVELSLAAASRLSGGNFIASFYTPKVSGAIIAVALIAALYGLLDARQIRTERVTLKSSKLPPNVEKIRVAQISDAHLGLILRAGFLKKVAAIIEENSPDILVATGDIVDAQLNHLDGLSEIFSAIKPPLGKYAVLGNHESYAGLGNSLDFLDKSGFRLLRDESVTSGGAVNIAGVDDSHKNADEKALSSAQPSLYTIFLKHKPLVDPKAAAIFDLQLSGHAHRGQIFPFNLLSGLNFPMQNGLYRLEGGASLYASRGTGTWGPPMRVFSPPEVTIIDIVREK